METKQVQTIRFIRTKGNHICAIVNDNYSIVKNEEKDIIYNVYPNVANGISIESTDELIKEFTDVYTKHFEDKQKALEEKIREEAKKENERIEVIKETVKGMTPQEFCEFYDIDYCETASHWSDLYNGRSGFGLIIDSDVKYELVQIAESVNNWQGRFGELKHRDGEHHNTFSDVFSLEDYRRNCSNYFSEKYFYKSLETEEEFYLDKIKNDCESIEEIEEALKEYNDIEEGYYSCGGSFVCGEVDDDFWGYYYDVYSYRFGYNFYSKNEFYNGYEREFKSHELDDDYNDTLEYYSNGENEEGLYEIEDENNYVYTYDNEDDYIHDCELLGIDY